MRLLHAADLHLDSPFRGLPAEKALQRRRESRAVLDAMAALVRERGVDAVLLSGDLFDGDAVYRETLEQTAPGSFSPRIFALEHRVFHHQ